MDVISLVVKLVAFPGTKQTSALWRHDLDIFLTLLALCAGNPPVGYQNNILLINAAHLRALVKACIYTGALDPFTIYGIAAGGLCNIVYPT